MSARTGSGAIRFTSAVKPTATSGAGPPAGGIGGFEYIRQRPADKRGAHVVIIVFSLFFIGLVEQVCYNFLL